MSIETQIRPETHRKIISIGIIERLLSANIELTPYNKDQISKFHANAVAQTIEQYIDFVPASVKNEIKKVVETVDSGESLKLEILGQYFNDNSNPYSLDKYGNIERFKNQTLFNLNRLVNLNCFILETEVDYCDTPTDRVQFSATENTFLPENGDFNDYNFTNIAEHPIMLNCNVILVGENPNQVKNPITEVKTNHIIPLPDIKSPFDTESQYYHSHPSFIKLIEIEGKICVFVTIQDVGEKFDSSKPISKSNIRDNCATVVYVIDKVDLKTKNGKIVIPPYNTGVQSVTLFKIQDNRGEYTSSQSSFNDSSYRLMPDISNLERDKNITTIKNGGALKIEIGFDARKTFYDRLISRYIIIQEKLKIKDVSKWEIAIKHNQEILDDLEFYFIQGVISNEQYEQFSEKPKNLILQAEYAINYHNPKNLVNIGIRNRLEIELVKVGLEIQRLEKNKIRVYVSTPTPSLTAIQSYRKEMQNEYKSDGFFMNNLALPLFAAAMIGTGGIVIESALNTTGFIAEKIDPVHFDYELKDFGKTSGIIAILTFLALSITNAYEKKDKSNHIKLIEEEIKRVSGLKVPKIKP
jgi:hypothetical protein